MLSFPLLQGSAQSENTATLSELSILQKYVVGIHQAPCKPFLFGVIHEGRPIVASEFDNVTATEQAKDWLYTSLLLLREMKEHANCRFSWMHLWLKLFGSLTRPTTTDVCCADANLIQAAFNIFYILQTWGSFPSKLLLLAIDMFSLMAPKRRWGFLGNGQTKVT